MTPLGGSWSQGHWTDPVQAMELECTCSQITISEWNRLMEGSKPLDYEWLRRRIREHLPELYDALGLDFHNPYENQTRVTGTHYVLVHSSIEYFIKKQDNDE